jgi:hypothetical protein
MAFVYKARKRLKVGATIYNPGDTVAEATTFRHLPALVHNGSIVLVQTNTVQSFKPKQRIPVSPGSNDWKAKPYKRFDTAQLDGWG